MKKRLKRYSTNLASKTLETVSSLTATSKIKHVIDAQWPDIRAIYEANMAAIVLSVLFHVFCFFLKKKTFETSRYNRKYTS